MDPELANALSYYAALLIIQYRMKPKAQATMYLFNNEALCDGLPQNLETAFNLDNAIGAQLNILGNIVGVPRYAYGLDLDHTFFSFVRYNDTTPRPGFGRYNDNPYPSAIWLRYLSSGDTELTDFEMLSCIYLKIMQNNIFPSLGNIANALWNTFGDEITIVENLSGGGITDSVELLLPLNNNDKDISQNNFSMVNIGVSFSNSSPVFPGTYYGVFNGSAYLKSPVSSIWGFGAQNFTIDLQVNFSSLPTSGNIQYLMTNWLTAGNFRGWAFGIINNAGTYSFVWLDSIDGSNDTTNIVSGLNIPVSVNNWNHFAIVRSNGLLYFFFAGNLLNPGGTPNTDNIFNINGNVYVGIRDSSTVGPFYGSIAEAEIVIGQAKWIANFTPPSSPYTEGEESVNITYHAIQYGPYYNILQISQYLNILPKPMGVPLYIATP